MRYLFAAIFMILAIGAGCSNSASILHPDNSNSILEVPQNTVHSINGLLGAYEMTINPNNMTAKLTPQRGSSLGESYLVSGITFFTVSPCPHCFAISGLRLSDEGYLEVFFDLTHPFEPGDLFLPPTARNRLDLDIFDVALIVVPKNLNPVDYPLTGTSIYNKPCVFASGYTKEINQITGVPVAHPYYLAVDNHADGTNTYNRFPMGGSTTFTIYLDLQQPLQFDLYLTFGYGASANFQTRLFPTYFNPEFNRKSPWKVQAIPPHGDSIPSTQNTWRDDDDSTEHNIIVKVWDWQHGITSISDPPQNPGDIATISDVTQVAIEIPGMTNSTSISTTPISGTGNNPSDPLTFEIPVRNENLISEGEYIGLVKVSDNRVPPTNGLIFEIDRIIDQIDPYTMEWHDIPEFTTYQTFTAYVVAELIVECEPQEVLIQGFHSGIQEENLSIVRTQQEWEALFALHDEFQRPPTVDFDNEMVVAVFLGGRSSTGYSVNIDCVAFYPSYIQVDYTENIPGAGCIIQPAFTYPYQIVTVPKSDIVEIHWIYHENIYDC